MDLTSYVYHKMQETSKMKMKPQTLILAILMSIVLLKGGTAQRVRCLESCDGAGLGLVQTISECCVGGVNGGGFLYQGSPQCLSCAKFQDISAQTEIIRTPNIPRLGEALQLQCVVKTDEILRAQGNLELTLPNGTIFATKEISSPETSIAIEFRPLTSEDIGEYRCTATVQSPEFPGKSILQFQSLNFGMITQPDYGLSIQRSGMPIAGRPYTLTCATNDSSSDIMWLSPTGEELQSGGRITVGDIRMEGVTRLTLMFSRIEVSDSGKYTCRSDTAKELTTIQVEGIEPSSEINIVTPPDGPIIGQPYVPMCNVSIFDSQQVNVMIQWIDPMGVTIVSCTAAGNISLSLNFVQLSATNAGSYTCRANITSPFFDGQQSIERMLNVRPIRDPDDDAQCHANAHFISQGGMGNCVCNPGYHGNGFDCEDIDECSAGNNNCHPQARCCNIEGSFACICNEGYIGDGVKCCHLSNMIAFLSRTRSISKSTHKRTTKKGRRTRVKSPHWPVECNVQDELLQDTTRSTKKSKSRSNSRKTSKPKSNSTSSSRNKSP